MTEHADLDLIAAFREGLLDAATAERVRSHLSRCADCARHQVALGEVTTLLQRTSAPPMPPRVAQRLDAALAAQIAQARGAGTDLTAGDPAGTPPATARTSSAAGGGRGHPPARRRFTTAMLRPLAAAAAVCLVAAGGYLVLRSFLPHPASAPTAAHTASRAAVPGRTFSPNGPFARPPAGPLAGTGRPGGGAMVHLVHSGTSYERARLRPQAEAVLRRYSAAALSPAETGGMAAPPSIPAGLAGCLRRFGLGRPLIVDDALYQGRQAVVIIAPPSGATGGHVWVAGPACSATASDLIADAAL